VRQESDLSGRSTRQPEKQHNHLSQFGISLFSLHVYRSFFYSLSHSLSLFLLLFHSLFYSPTPFRSLSLCSFTHSLYPCLSHSLSLSLSLFSIQDCISISLLLSLSLSLFLFHSLPIHVSLSLSLADSLTLSPSPLSLSPHIHNRPLIRKMCRVTMERTKA
jgi:hypothetical protein